MYQTKNSFNFSKNILLSKFINSKNLLLQYAKDITDTNKKEKLIDAANKISKFRDILFNCNQDDELLGIEGKVAPIYFSVFDYMLKTENEAMLFVERSKRPPENYCNCLLSFFIHYIQMI